MAIQAQMYSSDNLGFPLGGGSQDWMDNGCGFNDFSFNLQQQQQQQNQQQEPQYLQYLQLQQRSQNLFLQNSLKNNDNNNNHQSMVFSQGMAAQMEKEKQEIDMFISLQNERLRLGLLQQRKQQLQSILKKYESKAQIMLRQKDEEIAKAVNRTVELEDFLRRIEVESQTWQRVAKENEAMVVSLNSTIEQMRESACFFSNGVEDAESCCETGENRGVYEEQEENDKGGKMICKSCNSGNSCVILLPCRHLCSCKACEVFLDSCPVCRMVKKASIEVLF